MKVTVEMRVEDRIYDENGEVHTGGHIYTLRIPAEIFTESRLPTTIDSSFIANGILSMHVFPRDHNTHES